MYSNVKSGTVLGVQGVLIGVEVDVSNGLPVFEMVGFLGSEVKEAKERVRTALKNSGYVLPPKRITVNLSPADMHKGGSAYDLPIAVAILIAIGCIKQEVADSYMIMGELGLNGEVRRINGVLPMLSHAVEKGYQKAIVPQYNAAEGAVLKDMSVYGVTTLLEAVSLLMEQDNMPEPCSGDIMLENDVEYEHDFSDVIGQVFIKRGLEIAASGFHNLLMVGPPGAGKSMMAQCLPSIMPPLSLQESIELTKIYSIKGLLQEGQGLVAKRPFRSPHHTLSKIAMTGGGTNPVPGEMSLAHNGVLFLDELPEFSRDVIEVMRQPLEDKKITVSRVYASYTFPADFMLIAAINPCPCGYYPDRRKCRCSEAQVKRYLGKISQPLLDRIDLCTEIQPVPLEQLKALPKSESSATIRQRVIKAQQMQQERYKEESIYFNSQLSVKQIEQYCGLGKEEERFMMQVVKHYELSARAYHRILKVARTIADLDGEQEIAVSHLSEAIAYHNGNLGCFHETKEEL